jgi:AAA family ATP:ADP antiporter
MRPTRLLNVERGEAPAVVAGVSMLFLLFTSYFMLRPVRETMGIAAGVDRLQWLFTATFAVSLAVLPLFGWLASRVPRRRILPWVYGFFVLDLLGFAVAMSADPDNAWVGRTFYVWLSVFNLLAISLAWSVLADVFASAEARRLFALIAGGASLGGLAGPVVGVALVGSIGHAGLLILAAMLLATSALAAEWLHRWRDRHGSECEDQRRPPLGGNPFAGLTKVFGSPYLLGLSAFVLLLASVSTFLYFEQARIVAATFADPTRQTQVFGAIDAIVQALAIVTQVFVTGHLARRLGVGVLLVAVPLAMAAGFVWLAHAPQFAVFVVVMVVRRAGEYALVRPGREMLFTTVAAEDKYKAKNFIDTVVYRGGDAVSGWIKRLLDVLADNPSVPMFIGAALAAVWAACGLMLGRSHRQREAAGITARAGATDPVGYRD